MVFYPRYFLWRKVYETVHIVIEKAAFYIMMQMSLLND